MAVLLSRIRELREKAGLSQKRFASRIGVSEMTVRRWETAERSPSADALLRIASEFKTNVNYLLGQSDDASPPSGLQVHLSFVKNSEDFEDWLNKGVPLPLQDEEEMPGETDNPEPATFGDEKDAIQYPDDNPIREASKRLLDGMNDDQLRKAYEYLRDQKQLGEFLREKGA